jgi:anion-transporting  ArsA/GET3 family ATPase
LVEYLEDHGLRRVSKRLVSSGVVDVVATAIPGIRDVLVLGKIKQLEREQVADLIVVDAPATGHAITFLTSASGLLNAARGGPLRSQAADVVELLADPSRCRVILVTLPEELPVSETIESAFTLEDKAGVQLGPVIVNATDPEPEGLERPAQEVAAEAGLHLDPGFLDALEAARRFRLERHAMSAAQIDRLARDLPLPQLLVPQVEAEAIGPAEAEQLASALAHAIGALTPEVPAS